MDTEKYHWFSGLGMIHGSKRQDGEVQWYRNRWVCSKAASEQLGEQPVDGVTDSPFDIADTNVICHTGKFYGVIESVSKPFEFSRSGPSQVFYLL